MEKRTAYTLAAFDRATDHRDHVRIDYVDGFRTDYLVCRISGTTIHPHYAHWSVRRPHATEGISPPDGHTCGRFAGEEYPTFGSLLLALFDLRYKTGKRDFTVTLGSTDIQRVDGPYGERPVDTKVKWDARPILAVRMDLSEAEVEAHHAAGDNAHGEVLRG